MSFSVPSNFVRSAVPEHDRRPGGIAPDGVVVVYFSKLGGRLRTHQKIMLEADARAIATLKRYDFRGCHDRACDYRVPVFFVPDDTLLVQEATVLGIGSHNDFYGGVVPFPFVKTKAITHQLVNQGAERPARLVRSFSRESARGRAARLYGLQRPRRPLGGEANASARNGKGKESARCVWGRSDAG